MARIKYGSIVTSMHGSIGGLTFQTGKFGTIARNKPHPTRNPTGNQVGIRSKMLQVQQAWRDLSDADRLQWNEFISYSMPVIKRDRSIQLTGHSLFLKYQLFRLINGISLLTDITYLEMPTYPNLDEIELSGGVLNVIFDASVTHTSYWFLLSISKPRSTSKKFNPNGLRFMEISLASTDTFEITSPYVAYFGLLPEVGYTLHYTLTWFSVLSPIFVRPISGTIIVTS